MKTLWLVRVGVIASIWLVTLLIFLLIFLLNRLHGG